MKAALVSEGRPFWPELDLESLKGSIADSEWHARVELAGLYRLVALHGWDDMIFTHISARVPGPENHLLINPYGLFFREITASSLVKIDLDGNIVQDTPYTINPAGFTIHSAIHAARENAHYVMHLHTDQGIAVAAQAEGLLPLSQHALIALPFLAYHDYEGLAVSLDERERLVADLGTKSLMLLRNHGTLSVGSNAAECWLGMYYLERSCKQQVMALSCGRERVLLTPENTRDEVSRLIGDNLLPAANRTWPGCLRLLERELPGYDV